MPSVTDKQSTFTFSNPKEEGSLGSSLTKQLEKKLAGLSSSFPDKPELVRMLALSLGESDTDFLKGNPSRVVTGTKMDSGSGLVKYRLRNEDGGIDEFSVQEVVDDKPAELLCDKDHSNINSLLTRVRDVDLGFDDRLSALHTLLSIAPENASEAIEQQLSMIEGCSFEWHAALVIVAESAPFAEPSRDVIAKLLFQSADFFKSQDDGRSAEFCWCALQRAASLVSHESSRELLRFLTNSGFVDTRLAALQSIYGILEQSPDLPESVTKDLISRVFELGKKTLDIDVFVAGEVSAIGVEATMVLACLCQVRPNPLFESVFSLDREWMIQNLKTRYSELITEWQENKIPNQRIALAEKDLQELCGHNSSGLAREGR
jgi:hypothetical protein